MDFKRALFDLSPKEVLVLAFKLPPESRFIGDQQGGSEYHGWTPERYLAAATFNILQQILYVDLQSKTKKTVPRPTPIPTPGQKSQTTNEANPFEQMIQRAKRNRAQNLGE